MFAVDKKLVAISLCAMMAIAPSGFAQDAEAPAQAIYLTADGQVDPVSGTYLLNPALIIENGRVTAAGVQATLGQPAGAKWINLEGMTILPGMIDMHVHITGSPVRNDRNRAQQFEVLQGVVNAEKTLMAGFTTIRNVGAERYNDVALRDAINEGMIRGPRMFVSGPPVGIIGGHCSDDTYSPPEANSVGENVATGPWEMRAQVRENIKYGVDLIKTCSTGGVFSRGTLLGAPQGTPEELRAIVEEAHMRGLKVASHAHGTIGIKNAIEAGIDTIEHASFLDDETIRLAKKNGTYLSMDIYNTEYTLAEGEKNGVSAESMNKEREVGTVQRESFSKAVKAGVKIVLGTDAAIYPHGDNAKQLSRMVRFGMTNAGAIRAATSLAAEALGKDNIIGQLKPGYHADIIAVMGNPLEDVAILENVDFVMKDGVVYKD